MSHSGHFRVHGRHGVDVSAMLALGDRSARDSGAPQQHEDAHPIRIVNLSLAGACIDLDGPLTTGAPVTIEIVAPSLWDPLVLRGRVVWTRGGQPLRAGIAFEHTLASRAYALFDLLTMSEPLGRERDQTLGSG